MDECSVLLVIFIILVCFIFDNDPRVFDDTLWVFEYFGDDFFRSFLEIGTGLKFN